MASGTAPAFEAEVEEGNVEHKLHLLEPNGPRFTGLVTQLMWRCREGGGVARYRIGVSDAGVPVGLPQRHMAMSLETLRRMAGAAGARIVHLALRPGTGDGSVVAEATIRQRLPGEEEDGDGSDDAAGAGGVGGGSRLAWGRPSAMTAGSAPGSAAASPTAGGDDAGAAGGSARKRQEVTVAVCGGQNTGKSTWVACATNGIRDDGRGRARFLVFRHRHEVEDGRTSSIGRHIIGFDARGVPVNPATRGSGHAVSLGSSALVGGSGIDVLATGMSSADVLASSSHIVSLLDLAGDSKYIRTTIAGLLGSKPDYVQVMIPAVLPAATDPTARRGAAMDEEDSSRIDWSAAGSGGRPAGVKRPSPGSAAPAGAAGSASSRPRKVSKEAAMPVAAAGRGGSDAVGGSPRLASKGSSALAAVASLDAGIGARTPPSAARRAARHGRHAGTGAGTVQTAPSGSDTADGVTDGAEDEDEDDADGDDDEEDGDGEGDEDEDIAGEGAADAGRRVAAASISPAPAAATTASPAAAAKSGPGSSPAIPPVPSRRPRPRLDAVTREHLLLAVSLRIPLYVVITKVDAATRPQLNDTLSALSRFLRKFQPPTMVPGVGGALPAGPLLRASTSGDRAGVAPAASAPPAVPPGSAAPPRPITLVWTADEARAAARMMSDDADAAPAPTPAPPGSEVGTIATARVGRQRLVPVFLTSNVTGVGADTLMGFLSHLTPRHDWTASQRAPAEFHIDDVMTVDSDLIVGGLVNRGIVRVGATLLLGPDLLGHFAPVVVASIQAKRIPLAAVRAGAAASFRLLTLDGEAVPRASVRKGQVLLEGPRVSPPSARSTPLPPLTATPSDGDGSSSSHSSRRPLPATSSSGSGSAASTGGPLAATSSGSGGAVTSPTAVHQRVFSCTTFEADVTFCKPSHCTFRVGHSIVVHCAAIRQAARVIGLTVIPPNPSFGPVPLVRTGLAGLVPSPPAPFLILRGATEMSEVSMGGGSAAGTVPTAAGGIALEWSAASAAAAAAAARAGVAPSSDAPGSSRGEAPPSATATALAPYYHASVRVLLRFAHHPEFLVPGATVILRDGRAIAAGCVVGIIEQETRSMSAPAVSRRPVGRDRDRGSAAAALLEDGAAPVPAVASAATGGLRVRDAGAADDETRRLHIAAAAARMPSSPMPTTHAFGGGAFDSDDTGTALGGGGGDGRPRFHTVHFAAVTPMSSNPIDAPRFGGGMAPDPTLPLPAAAFLSRAERLARAAAAKTGGGDREDKGREGTATKTDGVSAGGGASKGGGGRRGEAASSDSSDDDGGGFLGVLGAAGGSFR